MSFVSKREGLAYWTLVSVRFYSERSVSRRVDNEIKVFGKEIIWRERHDLNRGNRASVERTGAFSETGLVMVVVKVSFRPADSAPCARGHHNAAAGRRPVDHIGNTARGAPRDNKQ